MGRFLVGRDPDSGQPVWSDDHTHLLACGPTRSGKTVSLLSHAVQLAPGPLIATSTKEDLLQIPSRATKYVLDLAGDVDACDLPTIRFSPLDVIHRWSDALLYGRILMDAAYSGAGSASVSNQEFWQQQGSWLTTALLWAARRRTTCTAGDIFKWTASRNTEAPISCLQHPDTPADAETAGADLIAQEILEGFAVGDSKTKPPSHAPAVWSFTQQAFALYANTTAADLSRRSDFNPARWVQGTDALHVVCRSRLANQLGPVIAVIIGAVVDATYRAHAAAVRASSTHTPRVSLVLDEVANTAPLMSLPAVLSEGAGQGISVALGAQDRAQLIHRFGEHPARTMINNCQTRVLVGQLGDRPFLEDLQALIGTAYREETSTNVSRIGHGTTTSSTTNHREVPWWSIGRLAHLEPGTGLYLRGWTPQEINLLSWQDRGRGFLA